MSYSPVPFSILTLSGPKRTWQCGQRCLKRLHGLCRRIAARGQIGCNSEAFSILCNNGPANDKVNAAATEQNGAQEATGISAFIRSRLGQYPSLIISGQKIDVTAHGMSRVSGRRSHLIGIELTLFESRPEVALRCPDRRINRIQLDQCLGHRRKLTGLRQLPGTFRLAPQVDKSCPRRTDHRPRLRRVRTHQ